MSLFWEYATEEHASEVLKYYENLLMRSIDVFYLAVVKKNCGRNCYGLEIGIMSNYESVEFDDEITPDRAFNGDFPENTIPRYLPIPSIYYKGINYVSKNILMEEEFNALFSDTRNTIHVELVKSNGIEINFDSEPDLDKNIDRHQDGYIDKSNTLLDSSSWFNFKYGGQPIKTANGKPGTLGAFFELKEFPNDFFGITNWHVISTSRDLSVPIYSNNMEYIGESFWQSLDINRECAFLKFDKKVASQLKKKYKDINRQWELGNPEIGNKVFQNGFGTYGNNSTIPNKRNKSQIYSNNATVKVYYTAFENNMRIFRNQILIKNFSEDGDSGALVLMEEGEKIKAVGLLYAQSNTSPVGSDAYFSLSVANNLNLIFNSYFHHKQEVFVEMTQNLFKTRLINQFKLSQNKFY